MSKDELISEFIKNPKYSSPWVVTAATMISEFPDQVDEEYCARYNNDQLKTIYEMLKYNATSTEHHIDLDVYANPEFNDTQMQLFLTVFQQATGDFEDLLVKLAKPEYSYSKLNFVVAGLVEGLDLTDHIDDFDDKQLAALYSGFKDKLDITVYDDNRIPGDMMNIMRCAMIFGYTGINYDCESKVLTVTKTPIPDVVVVESDEEE